MTRALLFLLFSVLLGACLAPNGGDPYSLVVSVCSTQDPLMGQYVGPTPEGIAATYLTPDCKAALESVIPYDNASFVTAPTGFKDKVTEAFQAIIAYPLRVDTNDTRLFGTQPALAGAIPLAFTDIYQQYGNPNQSLFNYILNHTDLITYGGDGGNVDAQYAPAFSGHFRQITIFNGFWSSNDPFQGIRNPFSRAGTLAHEARHGDSILHESCDPKTTGGNTGFECDNELQGPYGMSVVYLKYLLQGSATCSTPGCTPPLNPLNVLLSGLDMCLTLKSSENNRYSELEALLSKLDCGNDVTYEWILEHEGIAPPPLASDLSTVAKASAYGTPHTMRCSYH